MCFGMLPKQNGHVRNVSSALLLLPCPRLFTSSSRSPVLHSSCATPRSSSPLLAALAAWSRFLSLLFPAFRCFLRSSASSSLRSSFSLPPLPSGPPSLLAPASPVVSVYFRLPSVVGLRRSPGENQNNQSDQRGQGKTIKNHRENQTNQTNPNFRLPLCWLPWPGPAPTDSPAAAMPARFAIDMYACMYVCM